VRRRRFVLLRFRLAMVLLRVVRVRTFRAGRARFAPSFFFRAASIFLVAALCFALRRFFRRFPLPGAFTM
jgi:hypothetical protein